MYFSERDYLHGWMKDTENMEKYGGELHASPYVIQ